MPLSRFQSEILRLLAAQRSPESYVAGSTPPNRDSARYSDGIDIFHSRGERVESAALADTALLANAGFVIEWTRQAPAMYAAVVRRSAENMRLEWAADSDYRFFPLIKDELFGFTLHLIDIATNKALAAGGRREPRDVLDLLYIHDRHLPIGAVIWAAVAKDPGFSPESLIAEIRRSARYRADEYADLNLVERVDAGAVARRLRAILEEAEAFVRAMPAGEEGLLFLKDGQPVQPDPHDLANYVKHECRSRGHWPSSPEIVAAMIQRHDNAAKDDESSY